jgi:hypothetical protein
MNSHRYARRIFCHYQAFLRPRNTISPSVRAFSAKHDKTQKGGGLLPMEVIRSIKKDLIQADVNNDGRVDFEGLKSILRKYEDRFSEKEIEEVGEIFFVGKSGESVRHTQFLRGLQHTAKKGNPDSNPLELESIGDKRCWVSKDDTHAAFYESREEFDRLLTRYLEEKTGEK